MTVRVQGDEAGATHDCSDRSEVGRPAPGSVEDGRNLAEEVGAENAGVTIASAFTSPSPVLTKW